MLPQKCKVFNICFNTCVRWWHHWWTAHAW